jgi:hypothetical protein
MAEPDEPETFFGKVVPPVAADTGEPLTYDEVLDAVTPPGTDKAALLASLKAAQRTGGVLPGRTAPDISGPASGIPDVVRKAFPALGGIIPEPEDPFTEADAGDIALGAMFDGMLAGGIPRSSVERIIGVMLAEMPPPGQVVRDLLSRLGTILADEGVPPDVAARVVARMEAPGAG